MTQNFTGQFRGSVLETANVITTGQRVIVALADLPIVDTDQTVSMELATPSAATINLPDPASVGALAGSRRIRVFDTLRAWGDYPATFVATGGATIDGAATVSVSQPGAMVVFEWRGNNEWHMESGSAGGTFFGIGGGLGIDLPPVDANADSDEFNGSNLNAAWTLSSATLQAGDPQRGATIVGPNVVRQSTALRTGWLLYQPDALARYSRVLSSAMTQGAVYCKFSMDANGGVGPDEFTFSLCQSSAGVPDMNNAVTITLRRDSADITWHCTTVKVVAGVSTTVYPLSALSFTSLVQLFDRMLIYRNAGNFTFYVGSEAGGWKHLGTTAAAISPDRVAFAGSNTGGPSCIYGLDYVRRIDGALPTI